MLIPFNSFLINYAVRNHIYLASPSVMKEEDIVMPRFSVVHYLDISTDTHFPTRSMSYFSATPLNKKIPIQHKLDLVLKNDVASLLNKFLGKEVRDWNRANLKTFIVRDLENIPSTDPNSVVMINYNPVKDLYNYKGSLLSNHNRFYNLSKTYWDGVKACLNKDKKSYQFVSLDLPADIPSFNIIRTISLFTTIKQSRYIRDKKFYRFLDFYRWILLSSRDRSSMVDITDEDSKNIVVEFKYKGFSSFMPLYVIRSLCFDSKLDSSTKLADDKVQKLFLAYTRRIQDKVHAFLDGVSIGLHEGEALITGQSEEDSKDTKEQQQEVAPVVEDDEGSDPEQDTNVVEPIEGIRPKLFVNTPKKERSEKYREITDKTALFASDLNTVTLVEDLIKEEDSQAPDYSIYTDIIKQASEQEVEELEQTVEAPESQLVITKSKQDILEKIKEKPSKARLEEYIEESKKFRTLTSSEIRNMRRISEERELMVSPYSKKEQIDAFKITAPEAITVTKEDKTIKINNAILKDSFKEDPIGSFDRKYIKESLKKDIISSVIALENADLIIKNYDIEQVSDSVSKYEVHKITIKPFGGKESTVYFRIPSLDRNGEFRSGNITYRMRKTRQDLPIRKISATRVSLTSNYGKLFVGKTERKAFDTDFYILEFIRKSYLSGQGIVSKVKPGIKNLGENNYPYIYQLLASSFNTIVVGDITLSTDPSIEQTTLSPEVYKDLSNKPYKYIGYNKAKQILVIGEDDIIYNYTKDMEAVGSIVDILEIDKQKLPKQFTTIKVIGDEIPLGVALGYYIGFKDLIALTETKFTVLEAGKQYKAQDNDIVLRFLDYKLVLHTSSTESRLLFNGYLYYKDFLKTTEMAHMSSKDVYLNILESRSAGLIHLKELNNLKSMFLDPITKKVLAEIKEPQEFIPLLLRANNLLTDLSHRPVNDPELARIRGHDRIPGLMYRALAESVREYKIKARANSKVELDPYKVWNYITQDSSVKITEDLNPLLKMKENELVTLTGSDGLNKDAVPVAVRKFHPNEVGLTSEANVDSSDAGLNYYLTPYAKLENTLGIVAKNNKDVEADQAKALSSASLLSAMGEFDDPKRLNAASIQYSHSVPSPGYRQSTIRTGYDYVVPYRVSDLYAVMAKEDGVVTDLTETSISVRYKSGDVQKYTLGGRYGRAEGSIYKHNLVTSLNKDSKFKEGDHICYNDAFFEPDWLNEKRLVTKTTKTISVALSLTDEVFEDSASISKEVANQLTTTIIKEKIYMLDFKKNIVNLVNVGDEVVPTSTLFTMLEEDSDFGNLSESSIELLQTLAAASPKAKTKGVIDSIEVKYNGLTSDMSPTIKKLVDKLNSKIKRESEGTDYPCDNNAVTSEYRSQGKNLDIDHIELKIFIRVDLGMVSGDKTVFGNQLKNTIGNVFTYNILTDSGKKVDAFFSTRGIINRVVMSPILAGTTVRLTTHVSDIIAKEYFG